MDVGDYASGWWVESHRYISSIIYFADASLGRRTACAWSDSEVVIRGAWACKSGGLVVGIIPAVASRPFVQPSTRVAGRQTCPCVQPSSDLVIEIITGINGWVVLGIEVCNWCGIHFEFESKIA